MHLKSKRRIQPLLIVVDDLHDADQPSLQMLRFVARETKDAPLLMVGTYRDAEVKPSQQLGKLVGDLLREGRSLSLTGLSKTEVGEFIASRTGRSADEGLLPICSSDGSDPAEIRLDGGAKWIRTASTDFENSSQ